MCNFSNDCYHQISLFAERYRGNLIALLFHSLDQNSNAFHLFNCSALTLIKTMQFNFIQFNYRNSVVCIYAQLKTDRFRNECLMNESFWTQYRCSFNIQHTEQTMVFFNYYSQTSIATHPQPTFNFDLSH